MRHQAAMTVALLIVATVSTSCRSKRADATAPAPAPPAASALALGVDASSVLDGRNLFVSTATESNDRVRRVFPNGPATEDARAEIGKAPARPESSAPDRAASWVGEIELPVALKVAKVRAAIPQADDARHDHWVKGRRVGTDEWVHVSDADPEALVDRVVLVVDLVQRDQPVAATLLGREEILARSLADHLGAPPPGFSTTPGQATARAREVVALRAQHSDESVDVGVAIAAPKGKRFGGRLVWDAVYSAGFRWGDGDYFHWVPSERTDVSQGIGMGSQSGSGYFLPESITANDGSADVEGLEMSFNVARTWHPVEVFDVMARAAGYLARRLGGSVVARDGKPFDATAARARVVTIERTMTARGVAPGSELALHVF